MWSFGRLAGISPQHAVGKLRLPAWKLWGWRQQIPSPNTSNMAALHRVAHVASMSQLGLAYNFCVFNGELWAKWHIPPLRSPLLPSALKSREASWQLSVTCNTLLNCCSSLCHNLLLRAAEFQVQTRGQTVRANCELVTFDAAIKKFWPSFSYSMSPWQSARDR